MTINLFFFGDFFISLNIIKLNKIMKHRRKNLFNPKPTSAPKIIEFNVNIKNKFNRTMYRKLFFLILNENDDDSLYKKRKKRKKTRIKDRDKNGVKIKYPSPQNRSILSAPIKPNQTIIR